jgi:NADH:ubiquinone oxidoreductase subunit E
MKKERTDQPVVEVVFCMGSSCFSRGGNRGLALLQAYLKDEGLQDRVLLEGRLCQGQCQEGPNVTINGKTYHAVNPGVILDLVKYHLEENCRGEQK